MVASLDEAADERSMDAWELLPQERSAMALWLLLQQPMSTRKLADRLGLQIRSCRVMLIKIARYLPIYYDEQERVWRICEET